MTRETKEAAEAISTFKKRWLDVADAGLEAMEKRVGDLRSASPQWTGDAYQAGKRAVVAVDETFKQRPIMMHVLACAAGFALAVMMFRRRD